MFEIRSVDTCSFVATFCPEVCDTHLFYKAEVETYKVMCKEVG